MVFDTATASILATAAAGLTVNILQYLRESRTHKWAIEQAERERKERLVTAIELQKLHEQSTRQIAATTKEGVTLLSSKLDETKDLIKDNTDISVKAFDAANNVNEKIVAIGAARMKGNTDRQTDHIQEVVEDTHVMVHDLTEAVIEKKSS